MSLALVAISGLWFFRLGHASTDENLFTPPPSPAYLAGPLVTPSARLEPGAFIVEVNGRGVKRVEDVAGSVAGRDSAVRVPVVYAPDDRRTERIQAEVDVTRLRAAPLVDARGLALVIAVTAGGASDRAGMKVGDLITRIGGRTFDGVFAADQLMRKGGVGKSYAYDVLRDGRPITLHVTLASFGVAIPQLLAFASGLVLMVFGAWLLWVRPGITGARLVGLGFLLVGFGVSTILTGRDGRAPGDRLDLVAAPGAVLFGVALLIHANAHFPREWVSLARSRWFPRTLYWLATLSVIALAAAPNNLTFMAGLLASAGASAVAKWRHGDTRPPEHRQMRRTLTVAAVVAGSAVGLVTVSPLVLGQGAVLNVPFAVFAAAIVALPLSYLYTIGRFRVFDLQIRLRRDIQYSLVSMAWAAVPFAVLLWLLWALPQASLPLPGIRLTGTSVEVMDTAAAEPSRAALEKGVLMVLAILLAFGLRSIGERGQRFLASKFHRGRYDYRRAAQLIGEVTSTRLDLEGLCTGVVATLVGVMPVKRAGILLSHAGRTHCPPGAYGFDEDQWQAFCARSAGDLLAAMRDVRSEVSAAYAPPRIGDGLRTAGLEYVYPLRAKDALVGVLVLGEKQSESAFQNDDFEFLTAIGSQVAASVENAFLYEELAGQERLRHELEIARQIQMASLPQFTPHVTGLDVAGISIPAFEVGGDYFDFLNGQAERLTVMVGDVSGKGTSAALYMSKLQGILRSLHAFDLPPRELFVRTNQLLCHDLERKAFVTAIGGFFDTAQRRMVLARAGHLPLYHYRADRCEVVTELPRGLGFGLSTRPIFEDQLEELTIAYGPGDVFLFVTDGITDCQDPQGDLFGEERLVEAFAADAARETTAAGLRDALTARVRQFVGGRDPFDDITVVVVRAV
jgi:serine phosphatase RsbU (regulator of sigma subunit)